MAVQGLGGGHASLLPAFSYALIPMIDSAINIPINTAQPSESHPIVFHIFRFLPTQ